MKTRWFLLVCALILLGGFGLQLAFIEKTPWDWDEPVYTVIAQQTQILGYPSSPINATSGESGWYPYHPPFHFYVMANWFDLVGRNDITAGRVLSVIFSTALRAVMMLIVWVVFQKQGPVLLVGLLSNTDGWLLYTSSLVKLDTPAVLLGAVGVLFGLYSLRHDSRKLAALSGFLIGLAVIYKHVALIYVMVIVIHWLFWSKQRHHALILEVALSVMAIYVAGMIVTVQEPYLRATRVQLLRAFGLQEARGLNYGLDLALKALAETYKAFGGTLLSMGTSLLIEMWLIWKSFRSWTVSISLKLIVSWTLAAIIFLVVVRLRNPAYLVFLIVPALMLLSAQLERWIGSSQLWMRRFAWGLLGLILSLNLMTLGVRYFDFGASNALQQVQQVMAELPDEWVVLSEEPVCAFARPTQTCLKIGSYQSAESLAAAQPDVIILYSTITHAPPSSEALVDLINHTVPLPGVTPIQGWKERFTFLVVDHDDAFEFLP